MKDLPTQMYLILRCGLIHRFSFVPDAQEIKNGARTRSILLGHEINGKEHFAPSIDKGLDAVVFTAEQFSLDIKAVVELIFLKAATDANLENNINEYVKKFPPLFGGFG